MFGKTITGKKQNVFQKTFDSLLVIFGRHLITHVKCRNLFNVCVFQAPKVEVRISACDTNKIAL